MSRRFLRAPVAAGLALLLVAGSARSQQAPPFQLRVDTSPGRMVASAQRLATWAGVQMLEAGGNAADAAVAAAFAIAVVETSMNSIGGRNQILLRLPNGEIRGIDGTTAAPPGYDEETAPEGEYGYPAVGIPGAVAGLMRLHAEYGTLPLETLMAPAIRYAEEGYRVLTLEAERQAGAADQVAEFEGSRRYFLKEDGTPYQPGDLLVQGDLAATLRKIAAGGGDVFYRGEIARAMADDILANGGVVTMEALDQYRAEDAMVVRGSYRGFDVAGSYVPSYGVVVIEALQILEHFDLAAMTPVERGAYVAQALSLAFEDTDLYGPEDVAGRLTSKEWAAERASRIPPRARMGEAGREEEPAWLQDHGHTTHLSTADGNGMMVALTQTLGPAMGSKVATPGLGFLYASTLGGYLSAFGDNGRAWSNIAPIIVTRDGESYLVLGAAGGGDIPVAIVNAIVHHLDGGLSFPDALAAPRVGPSRNGTIELETHVGAGWSPEAVAEFQAMGYRVRETASTGSFGRIHGIRYHADSGEWEGAADPDWEGTALGPRRR